MVPDVQAASAAAGAEPSRVLTLGPVHTVPAEAFTVSYFPRQGWPFVVQRNKVDEALQLDWHQVLRVRMLVPLDVHELQSSRQAGTPEFFQGTITSVNDKRWCKLQVCVI
jgi:hypothetical protein